MAIADEASEPSGDMTVEQLRHRIDEFDHEIMDLWQRRAALSRALGDRRVEVGETRIALSSEYAVVARYRAALGSEGGQLALLALRAGRSGVAAGKP